MLLKRNNFNKAISSLLLVLLLLIHSIKILHTHSNIFLANHNCDGDSKEKKDVSLVSGSNVDCSICSYQINKDADDLTAPFLCGLSSELAEFNSGIISTQILSFHSAFENRGPPFLI